jgi:starvation-inducible DNA-binding protein
MRDGTPGSDDRQWRFSAIGHTRAMPQGKGAREMHKRSVDDASGLLQPFGHLVPVDIGLAADVRHTSVAALNRLLAHALALRDLYKKAHWQTSGATFSQLHALYDKHASEQADLADELAERGQMLGGVALALPEDVVQATSIARAPRGSETPRHQLEGLRAAHGAVLGEARPLARRATETGDDGTNDLIVGRVIRGNELHAWFVGEHLVTHGLSE